MRVLRTLKNASKLRKFTNYCPEKSNHTRWESTYKILKQSLLADALLKADYGPEVEEKLIPASRPRKRNFDNFLENEKIIQSV